MNKSLAELVHQICSEKNREKKLDLIEQLKELLDEEDRLKGKKEKKSS